MLKLSEDQKYILKRANQLQDAGRKSDPRWDELCKRADQNLKLWQAKAHDEKNWLLEEP